MENFSPGSAFSGGVLIGVAVTLFLLFNGRMAGISGIMHGTLSARGSELLWRLCFLAGLIIGAFLFYRLDPGVFSPHRNPPAILLTVGGFLVGFGTRAANGCTSGHGICGLANLSLRSVVATLLFMSSGFLTVYLMRHVFGVAA